MVVCLCLISTSNFTLFLLADANFVVVGRKVGGIIEICLLRPRQEPIKCSLSARPLLCMNLTVQSIGGEAPEYTRAPSRDIANRCGGRTFPY